MKKGTTSTAESHGNGNRSEMTNVVNSKKSKHDANLRKNGFIHFQIGLIVAMLLVYFGLEYAINKIQPTMSVERTDASYIFEYHEDANNFKVEKAEVEPRQKVADPTKFIIKPDDFKISSQVEFKSVPVDDNAGIIAVDSIIAPNNPNDEELVIPIAAVDEVPIFPGCEKVEKYLQRACFEERMQKHVLRNFKYPDVAIETRTQGKVYVTFTVAKDGLIEDVILKGPAKVLENEAARIIDKLPQMKPGKRQQKPVKVSFSLPIVFRLQ